MDSFRLQRLSEVTESLCFQLSPGKYEEGKCWADDSVYIKEEAFSYLETVVSRCVPAFSHWAFTDVPSEQWLSLLQHLTQLAEQLDAATDMNDVRGDVHFLFRDSEEKFAAAFASNTRALATMIRELVTWAAGQLKTHDGIAILGI